MKHAAFLRDRGCVLICCCYIAESFKYPILRIEIQVSLCFGMLCCYGLLQEWTAKRSVQNFSFSLQNPSSTCYYWWILKSQGFCSKVTKLFMNHTKNWAELLWDHHYKWWISSTSLLVAITANCSLATNSRKFVQKNITHIKNPTLFSFPK